MKKRFLRYFLSLEYFAASLIACAMIMGMHLLDNVLPPADETSFLNPVLGRFDFLNIADVSLDAIFAIKDMSFADTRIVVVNLGTVAPAPDGKIAMLLYKLKRYGAKTVGIDVLYDEQHFERFSEERRGEIDLIKQAFADHPDVVIVNGFDKESLQPAVEIDSAVAASVRNYGFANLEKDNDEVVRRFWPYRNVAGQRWLSFPIELLRQYDPSLIAPLLELPEEQQIIYYTGSYEQFQTVPIDDVISSDVYASLCKDAIVLVGYVNEGGFVYLGDTHKTPMGRRVGIEGPDMPGILIHANIINMLLRHEFIMPAPAWLDWGLAFLLAYLSIALYRVLRVKAVSQRGIAALITVMLIVETIMVFFFPILSFFFFGLKVSYDLMASAVIIFIPAAAFATKGRVMLLGWRAKRLAHAASNPIPERLWNAYGDDDALPLHLRLLHAAQSLVHASLAVRLAERVRDGRPLPAGWRIPGVAALADAVPEINVPFNAKDARSAERQYFYKFLAGRKDQFLRESAMKDLLFSTQLGHFNEFFYFDEWEILSPHVLHLFEHALHGYTLCRLLDVGPEGAVLLLPEGSPQKATGVDGLAEGTYFDSDHTRNSWTRVSPFIEHCECKLHRVKEVFVFAALVPRQFGLEAMPVYYGETPACEPVLPSWTLDALRAIPDAGDAPVSAPIERDKGETS